jgi:hypothetical protein
MPGMTSSQFTDQMPNMTELDFGGKYREKVAT